MAEKCNSLSHFVNIVYNCFLIMYCIVSYCVLCMNLICYLYTNVSTKVTRNKDIYIYISFKKGTLRVKRLKNPINKKKMT
jgi:hypothetical protein